MRPSRSPFILTLLLSAALTLSACDDKAESTASADAAPQAGDELPVASNPTVADNPESLASEPVTAPGVSEDSSMGEGSPGGEAVTEQELPPQADMPPPPSREVFQDAECSFESWVGAKVDEAAVKATGRPYRILTPDSMMTMDHSPERINVVHDADMIVTRVWCG